MKTYSFYDPVTGLFTGGKVTLPSSMSISINTPAGCAALEGDHDGASKRLNLVSGELEPYTPPTPTAEFLADRAKSKRAGLLAMSDWVVARSVETGQPIPSEWLAYRSALRDITTQAGFPTSIDWPKAPT